MLLKKAELDAIRSGQVSLVFRRWLKPSVRTGGTLKTGDGVLAIDRVIQARPSEITDRDAAAAGFDSLTALLDRLDSGEGDVYRIELRYAGPDPRVRLREDDSLDHAALEEIVRKLDRLDSASRSGPWTRRVLVAIERQPRVLAARLAKAAGFERDSLKGNVRS